MYIRAYTWIHVRVVIAQRRTGSSRAPWRAPRVRASENRPTDYIHTHHTPREPVKLHRIQSSLASLGRYTSESWQPTSYTDDVPVLSQHGRTLHADELNILYFVIAEPAYSNGTGAPAERTVSLSLLSLPRYPGDLTRDTTTGTAGSNRSQGSDHIEHLSYRTKCTFCLPETQMNTKNVRRHN